MKYREQVSFTKVSGFNNLLLSIIKKGGKQPAFFLILKSYYLTITSGTDTFLPSITAFNM
jgi:hypothetical protein